MQVRDPDETDITSYVALMKQQLAHGGPDGGPDDELAARFAASGFDTIEGWQRRRQQTQTFFFFFFFFYYYYYYPPL
jgi:hypothetical protein